MFSDCIAIFFEEQICWINHVGRLNPHDTAAWCYKQSMSFHRANQHVLHCNLRRLGESITCLYFCARHILMESLRLDSTPPARQTLVVRRRWGINQIIMEFLFQTICSFGQVATRPNTNDCNRWAITSLASHPGNIGRQRGFVSRALPTLRPARS